MSLIPESAPFSPQQRAWLDGFLSASLGLKPAVNGSPSPVAKSVVTPQEPIAPAANGNALKPSTEPALKVDTTGKPAITYTRDDPFPARVIHVRPLNGTDSRKDVRAVALDLSGSGLTYEAGDALGLYPENDHDLVEEILEALGATGEEPVVTPESRIVPARIALLKGYDITRVGEDLLHLLADAARDENEAAQLKELAEEDADDWLAGRDVLDVLRRFASVSAATSEIIPSLMPLQPRLYSIASSQKAHPNEVHLTIGVVRYDANERTRKGVASTFMAERVGLAPGQRVGVFVHPSPGFRLPENGDTGVIMVGPGTGIAPFRAFLQERRATAARGENWLFFGDQHEHCDFLYRDEIADYQKEGYLAKLDTAFSRDQAEKIYVQTRMQQRGAEIWKWLEDGAHFYVCGDAKRMAKDVDNALHEIARTHGGLDEAGAKVFIQSLIKGKRYQRDVY